ncbi:MAG: NAD(P)-dependent dehydrogenase (short-subunit alcohol dehydrogenase family) [Rhodothermales bacterium]|jgi:NAD(P)-dependent dehydrogenase (short-subunit alcohol dehydrogenase family)
MDHTKVLITGAAGGLGTALATQLAQKGANLLLLDKNAQGLNSLSDDICALGLEEPGICQMNLMECGPKEHEGLFDILQTQYEGLDIIIHCAAAFPGLQPLDQLPLSQWQECLQVNVTSVWLSTMTCLPLLKASSNGRVVLIHESTQITAAAYWGAYAVSKAALRSFSHILEEELQNTGVQVLNCFPEGMRTALRASAYHGEDPLSIQDPALVAAKIINEIENSFQNQPA